MHEQITYVTLWFIITYLYHFIRFPRHVLVKLSHKENWYNLTKLKNVIISLFNEIWLILQ